MATWIKMREGSGHPDAAGVVHRNGAHTARLGPVQVSAIAVPGSATGFIKRFLDRRPGFVMPAHQRDRAVRAVKIVVDVLIGFELAVVRQHIGVRPAVIAQRSPQRKVFG